MCLLRQLPDRDKQQHLQHDYFTDIITFDHSENKKNIEGDLYISVDRTKENAKNTRLMKTPNLLG